ncbi:MAG: type II toxin-antitoxin system RelE/ParE family toxin [Desulfovibrio sp.]|jgi:toxin ParE1/3/4|nr:type II toxin-antitoxin system RelE/ParE family toxin [Desulfovibrio sp.]
MRIKWLKRAIKSLDAAMAHIAQDDEETARDISDYIHMRVESLQEQPLQGRPGRIFGTRELVMDKYPFIVPYRVKGEVIQILRIFHTSRKPPQKW